MNSTDYGVSIHLKILTGVLYSISFSLGVGSNILVLLVSVFFQRMQMVSNFFIFILALSDLLFVILCIPTTYITAFLITYWPFSHFFCVFFNYMQSVSVTSTVYTLMWFTMDKYWALCKPFKTRMSKKFGRYLIVSTWFAGCIVSLPIACYTKLEYYIHNESNVTHVNPQCIEEWPMNNENDSYKQMYSIGLMFIQYLLPVAILIYCYVRIGYVLHKSKAPGESIKSRDEKMTESKKRMIKMSFLMVFTFIISWAPMQIITIYRFIDSQIVVNEYFSIVFFICHWLAVSRSFVNPFIYAFNNNRFRKGFKYFICFNFFKVTPHQYESFMIQSQASKYSCTSFKTEVFQLRNSQFSKESSRLIYSSGINLSSSFTTKMSLRPPTPSLKNKNKLNFPKRETLISTRSVDSRYSSIYG